MKTILTAHSFVPATKLGRPPATPCYRLCKNCQTKFLMLRKRQQCCSQYCWITYQVEHDKKLAAKIRYWRIRKAHAKRVLAKALKRGKVRK